MTIEKTLEIRPFEGADADAVWELNHLALAQTGAHPTSPGWDADLRCIEEVYLQSGGCFVVGVVSGRIVAMGGLRRLDPSRGEVVRMRVHPDFQETGIGSAILERIEREARRLGYATLCMETTTLQVAAQRLYRKYGYVETGGRIVDGFQTILFEKVLS